MAQTQTEHASSPTMTVLTIQWACQNSVNKERSDEVSGSTDCATSAGFIWKSFGQVFLERALCGVRLRRSNRERQTKSPPNGQTRASEPLVRPLNSADYG